MSVTEYLFGFSGRINRAKLWLLIAISMGVYFALMILFVMLIGVAAVGGAQKMSGALAAGGIGAAILMLLSFPVFIVLFIASLSLSIRRLHDRNKSGWWLIVFWVVPFVLDFSVIGMALGNNGQTAALGFLPLIAFGIVIWGFVELYCLRGTIGENPYGPDPLDPLAPARVFE